MRTPPRSKWDRPLRKGNKSLIPKRSRSVIDWDRALRLRKQGIGMKEIAAQLGVPYATIQGGMRQRLGPAVGMPRARESADRRRLYQLWRSLRARTTDPRGRGWKANGGLGVRLCTEWQQFEAFRSWALRLGWKPCLCLARIRVPGPYSPGNCE